jgi:hypothetical protein
MLNFLFCFTGDMLSRIMGQKVKQKSKDLNDPDVVEGNESGSDSDSDDEPETILTHSQQINMLLDALGAPMYHKTLSCLYILRCDASGVVRQTAMNAWRMLVSNTPRQLKEILPVLLQIVLELLAREPSLDDDTSGAHGESEGVDVVMNAAAQSLGDIVRKLGEGILDHMIPLLAAHFEISPRGVCLALVHVMHAAARQHLNPYMEKIVKITSSALKHSNEEVREAGASAFDELLRQTGGNCIDAVLIPMLQDLPSSLPGLQHVMSVRSHVVMPVLLPSLLQKKDPESCKVLASLLSVSSLGKKSSSVLESLLKDYHSQMESALRALLSHPISEEELDSISDVLDNMRGQCLEGVALSISFLSGSAEEYLKQEWLSWLMGEIDNSNASLIEPIYKAMDTLVSSISKEDLDSYITIVSPALAKYKRNVYLFSNHPRGPGPILTIILHSLMYGTHKEQAIRDLIQIILLTKGTNLKPHVTQMTGPLIRMLGERLSPVIKILILESIFCLLNIVGQLLKPFIPQLTRTLLKQLENDDLRVIWKASEALGPLFPLHPRPETLITELFTLAANASEEGIQDGIVSALQTGIHHVKDRSQILKVLKDPVIESFSSKNKINVASAYLAKFPQDFVEVTKPLNAEEEIKITYVLCSKELEDLDDSSVHLLSAVVKRVLEQNNDERLVSCAALCAKFLLEKTLDEDVQGLFSILLGLLRTQSHVKVKRSVIYVLAGTIDLKSSDVSFMTKSVTEVLKASRDRSNIVKFAADLYLSILLASGEYQPLVSSLLSSLDSELAAIFRNYQKKVLEQFEPRASSQEDIYNDLWQ